MSYYLTGMEEVPEEFVKTFPTLHCKPPESRIHLWVFWSQDHHHHHEIQQQQQGFQINNNDSFSADVDSRMISDKIKHSFSMVKDEYLDTTSIIQFWAPVTTIRGRRLLSTSGQPFAVTYPDKELSEYRLRCVEYQYNIIHHVNNNKQRPDINEQDDGHPFIISDHAPTATAFLNRLPLAVSFLNRVSPTPLVDSALECHLRNCFMLPICCPSQSTSCCIGVVEFSTHSLFGKDPIISMIRALEEVGLGVFQLQERIPYQIKPGLKPARDEIEHALKIACESNDIALAQVWISFEDENHVPFSSYLEDTRKKQMLSLKLTGHLVNTGPGYHQRPYAEYNGLCDMFPLRMEDEFVQKTLKDYKPRFCDDVSEFVDDKLLNELFFRTKSSRLAICLSSNHTGAFHYVFEFIWNPISDSVLSLEALVLTLKKFLPSFKPAPGAELGNELDIIDVENSTTSEIKFLKIFQGERLSPLPSEIKLLWEFFKQTYLFKKSEDGGLLVFGSQDEEGSQNNSSSADLSTRRRVRDKIISALHKLKYHPWGLIIQFWEPVKIGNKRILSTNHQPFAVCNTFSNNLRKYLRKYRLLSLKCEHNIDVNKQIGIHGTPATAFLNRFPEVVVQDTSVHKGSPLVRHALECTRMTSLMLPICCPPEISCLGVVECSLTRLWPRIDKMLKEINRVLKEEHLSVFRVQERIPYKNIDGLKPAKDEIEKALKIVCESHNIRLAQVWIPFTAENSVPYSFSLVDTQAKAMFAVQLTSYGTDYSNDGDGDGDDDDDDADLERYLRAYSYLYDFVPLKMGEELVLKTLQDHKSRFYKDTFQPNNSLLSKLQDSKEFRSSGLAICLRSTETRDFDYMFEFAWNHKSDIVIFMEALLLTLKRCLPNFKFACGAELGDELDVESAIKNFKVFQGKISSPMPELEALERGKNPMVEDCTVPSQAKREKGDELSNEDITQLFGITMEEAAKILKISLSTFKRQCKYRKIPWEGPKHAKKKANDQSNTNGAIQDPPFINRNENTLPIKAEYEDDVISLHCSISQATFDTVEKEIHNKFKLPLGTFRLKYLDIYGELMLVVSDQDLNDCITFSRNLDPPVARLLVLPSTRPI